MPVGCLHPPTSFAHSQRNVRGCLSELFASLPVALGVVLGWGKATKQIRPSARVLLLP